MRMGREYVLQTAIAFGDVDSAKVLFYPRFFDYCHLGLESFSEAAFGISYAALLRDERMGFPTVHIEADYRRPFVYGDGLDLAVTVVEIGDMSVVLRFRGRRRADQESCAEAKITKVCVDLDAFRGRVIPPWMREGLAAYLEG